ncbi:histidine phosphatase family protein [Peribacillus kribbensis]|uniref:histidine phosphatase family protein n=1 Tax=Peribacillus kribbensis TaxID=356658 RepID=UPI0012DCFDF9|nr:histidine phosphatase family protein [Peribacillus kribbensis]
MEISLIPMDNPHAFRIRRYPAASLKRWVSLYDRSGVQPEKSYPPETIERISNANIVIASDLTRSLESAILLKEDVTLITDPLFREAEIPHSLFDFWGIKLKPNLWGVIFRCFWLLGYSGGNESLKSARKRAEKAAGALAEYAQTHSSAASVGNGFLNRLIGIELQKMAGRGRKKRIPNIGAKPLIPYQRKQRAANKKPHFYRNAVFLLIILHKIIFWRLYPEAFRQPEQINQSSCKPA